MQVANEWRNCRYGLTADEEYEILKAAFEELEQDPVKSRAALNRTNKETLA
jgi:hypothetical protein